MPLPMLYLVRHGQTEWAMLGRHTGLSDIPLTDAGVTQARELLPRLGAVAFSAVFTSPLQRASRTCELAGFGAIATRDADLVEWDYGDYEGKTSVEIRSTRPDWNLFRDGCPGGESIEQVSARADRFIARARSHSGIVAAFSSGHISRVLIARWLGMPAAAGKSFLFETASVCILGYEHALTDPVIRFVSESGTR